MQISRSNFIYLLLLLFFRAYFLKENDPWFAYLKMIWIDN